LQIKDDNGELYTKRGNSNTKERIAIIDRFIKVFGVGRIEVLTGDREFIGKEWLQYLQEKKIKFCMREKKSKLIKHKGKYIAIKALFQDLKLGEYHYFGTVKIYGMDLHLTGSRMQDDYLIIISNYEAPKDEILLTYSKRWEIETMFKAFKSQGFNLEDTHLTKKDRIEKLLALMAIAFVWSYIAGEFFETIEPIKLKKNSVIL
jgi:transposase